MTDLDSWHLFETEAPDTFASMYQFWVRKPAARSGRTTAAPQQSALAQASGRDCRRRGLVRLLSRSQSRAARCAAAISASDI